ncbi:PREDICTED: U4/U6 small nuclear ribonucleoprotein Prp3-like [Priapulus caudatus]|uniref:U4/U6 small nuclear ribonucleoprotein Prp3-like n=1 Tax=Priapulus caudatus TaxID=37621 RepID=A0ABM1ERX1_PRICU|nr:PREDICTED: U4/U6 small nuclear ribonucleoprotein Prp3-like [Priapulus caudatus]
MSRPEVDQARPKIEKVVYKFLGYSEPHAEAAAVSCFVKGYDRKKITDKLSRYVDDRKARKLTDNLVDVFDDLRRSFRKEKEHESSGGSSSRSSRKRYTEDVKENGEGREGKKAKKAEKAEKETKKEVEVTVVEESPIPGPEKPSPGMLTAMQIKDMMANAQKMIEERKKQLNLLTQAGQFPAQLSPQMQLSSEYQVALHTEAMEKAKKAAEIQARIQAQLQAKPNLLLAVGPGTAAVAATAGAASGKPSASAQSAGPVALILDDEGRTVDATGRAIHIPVHTPTLKANIRAKRREEFKQVQDKPPEEFSDASSFFDARLQLKSAQRVKRKFRFVDQGRYIQLAQRVRTKAQLEKLQKEIFQVAKKTGIQSAAKLALIAPKSVVASDEIPDVEWWDAVVLRNESYTSLDQNPTKNPDGTPGERFDGVTNLVEHPIQLNPPADTSADVPIPVMLTKKERKKLRRMTRRETWKEKQEKIRLGLNSVEEPKMRMSNLMRVLGMEAVQDPTKIEAQVRTQMAKRQKDHEDANAARKLTREQRSDKKIKKLTEDTTVGVHVAVYRVRDLSSPAKKFKVETNCQQLLMTGTVVLYRECSVVVVEGGPKQQKKYRRLMLHRIKWEEDGGGGGKGKEKDKEGGEASAARGGGGVNACVLVWEGTTKERSFGEMKFKLCPAETFAREHFKKHGVEHYWDLAYTQAIMEASAAE